MPEAAIAAPPPSAARESRIAGVYGIRFLLALWVYFSHFGFLPFAVWIGKATPVRQAFSGIANSLFDGPAAVIGFFIISGLCIHYPLRKEAQIPILSFYVRRYIRILAPLLAAIALSGLIGTGEVEFYQSILWSLVAESIYYAIYPLVRVVRRSFGWPALFTASYFVAALLIARNPWLQDFHEFGPELTWALGLPAWLLGCYLAENLETVRTPRPGRIWACRAVVWGLASAATMLRFHARVGYPITLTILGPVMYWWLRLEFGLAGGSRSFFESGALKSGGQFSYSIYLVHGPAMAILASFGAFFSGDSLLAGAVRPAFMLFASYLFFRLVERPSHLAARWSAQRLSSQAGLAIRVQS